MTFAVRPVGATVADDLARLVLAWVDRAASVALLLLLRHCLLLL